MSAMPRLACRCALIASMLALSLASAIPSRGAGSSVLEPSPAALDTLLTSTLNPPRDLVTLTERLKLHSTTPINPIVNARPTDYPVGRVDRFYVFDSNTANGVKLLTARLALKTTHAYFYVQQGVQVNTEQLARSAAVFESHTYPTNHAAFGSEWLPGVDNDQHITIFNGLLQGGGELGYVTGEDLYPRVTNRFSNQRKMIYMNLALMQAGGASYDSTLAHEFQHVIHASLHPEDDAWLNEGSSVLAEVLNGHSAGGLDLSKLQAPDTQLTTFDPGNFAPYYGGGYLWLLYLYEHFGGNRVTRTELATNTMSNMPLFDAVLAKLGVARRADDVFGDWVVANFLNDRSIAGGRYGYTHVTARAVPTSTVQVPFTHSGTMHQYAANYIDIPSTGGAPLTLRFTGQPTVPLLDTVAPSSGFWWSNRGDWVDDALTLPPLDLRTVKHATLHYQLWYDLEQDYDYGYVEVSTDGGKTWYAQRTPRTTNTDPNGNNLGDGYTGSSCSPSTRAQHCWVNEQIDLSRYAGKQILVRFEQVTDDEVNGQGLAIAHLQVPELGFVGDTTRAGWQAAGWVRADNTLAERWIVQAIVYRPNGIAVLPMQVGPDGHGSLHIPAGTTRVVVAVSPEAPSTTTTNSYTLSAGS